MNVLRRGNITHVIKMLIASIRLAPIIVYVCLVSMAMESNAEDQSIVSCPLIHPFFDEHLFLGVICIWVARSAFLVVPSQGENCKNCEYSFPKFFLNNG